MSNEQANLNDEPVGLPAEMTDTDMAPGDALAPMTAAPMTVDVAEAKRALDAYFSGKKRAFTLPLDLRGTDFQKRVWRALRSGQAEIRHEGLDRIQIGAVVTHMRNISNFHFRSSRVEEISWASMTGPESLEYAE